MRCLSALILLLVVLATAAVAQTITYYIQGLHRQGNAEDARAYLGITNTGGGGFGLDLRTNAYNYWWGTNVFTNDFYGAVNQVYSGAPNFIYNGAKWMFGGTNIHSTALAPYSGGIHLLQAGGPFSTFGRDLLFGISDNFTPLWFDESFVPNAVTGSAISSRRSNDSSDEPLCLAGFPVAIGSRNANSGNLILFIRRGSTIGGITDLGILWNGARFNPEPGTVFGNSGGGIFATNLIYGHHYMRAFHGFVTSSNSWQMVPNFKIDATVNDSFTFGDAWAVSSNGVPTWVWKDYSGVLHTNQFGATSGTIPSITNGIASLSAGSATVLTTMANDTRTIVLGYFSVDSKQAMVGYSNVVNGASFKIYSSNVNDTNKVSWLIVL